MPITIGWSQLLSRRRERPMSTVQGAGRYAGLRSRGHGCLAPPHRSCTTHPGPTLGRGRARGEPDAHARHHAAARLACPPLKQHPLLPNQAMALSKPQPTARSPPSNSAPLPLGQRFGTLQAALRREQANPRRPCGRNHRVGHGGQACGQGWEAQRAMCKERGVRRAWRAGRWMRIGRLTKP
jgi:hypothetical protein